MTKLPPIWNRIQRKQLQRTGSREFCEFLVISDRSWTAGVCYLAVLEYEEILPTNKNNNRSTNSIQEQRYVEQERPIQSHIGLALLALLVFPPIGK